MCWYFCIKFCLASAQKFSSVWYTLQHKVLCWRRWSFNSCLNWPLEMGGRAQMVLKTVPDDQSSNDVGTCCINLAYAKMMEHNTQAQILQLNKNWVIKVIKHCPNCTHKDSWLLNSRHLNFLDYYVCGAMMRKLNCWTAEHSMAENSAADYLEWFAWWYNPQICS